MMHTEEEARKLWCPMARVAAHFNEGMKNNVAFNRDPDGDPRESTYCIASRCMMWRWEKEPFNMRRGDEFFLEMKLTGLGYCGLGGKP